MNNIFTKFFFLVFLLFGCRDRAQQWNGAVLTQPRMHLSRIELQEGKAQELIDLSFFAKPSWSKQALHPFAGTILIQETEMLFPKEKAYYPGETIFPKLEIDFIAHQESLIPLIKEKISTRHQSKSLWDVVIGTGRVWHEVEDGEWSRASFPFTLTDRYVGQARNCVATFVYQADTMSPICFQCSQETADIDDKQLGNISGILKAQFKSKQFIDSVQIIDQHRQFEAQKLPTHPLREIDSKGEVANYLERMKVTNAPTSMGAILLNEQLYIHPPKTRHGLYPYPEDMRHALYSVTKSMAGALALMYLEERYEENVFNALISDYVPTLAQHKGWQGVTFAHTLNMVTGTVGSDRLEHFYSTVIAPETAEEAINSIATLGDAPEAPGQKFNYASANHFVLSYAMQQYVKKKEGEGVNYWDLVHENVLVPIGAGQFSILRTLEKDESQTIPILALGALPTLDEAAKIAQLFVDEGSYQGQQLLNKKRVQEVFGATDWKAYNTGNDFRGSHYQHAFWSRTIQTNKCPTKATFMLGFGSNYVVFLPSKVVLFRFFDEHDLDISELINAVENIVSSCPEQY